MRPPVRGLRFIRRRIPLNWRSTATQPRMLEPTPLYGGNADFLESLYEQYLRDPASVDARWRGYFERMAMQPAQAPPAAGEPPPGQVRADIAERARAPRASHPAAAPAASPDNAAKQAAVSRLIQ